MQSADHEGDRWVAVVGGRVWDTQVTGGPRAYDIAISDGRVLATGPRWWFAEGDEYREVTPEDCDSRFRVAAGGGLFYVFEGSTFGGELWVGDGHDFALRVLPTRDVRRIAVDEQNPERAIAVSWGQGVHLTENSGQTWTDLGHWGAEIRSLAVDWSARRVYVAPTGLVRSGVWARNFLAICSRHNVL